MSFAERLAPVIARRLGLRPSLRSNDAELATLIEARRRTLGLPSAAAYVEHVSRAPEPELAHLAAAFTNGWTWFFRDHDAIVALAERLRASAVGGPARVWVAGCSTGEEAYGVAIACAERGVDVRVTATDVDAARIEIARRAEYGAHALRRVPPATIARWFEMRGDRARVAVELRARVTLRVHNLLDPPLIAPGGGGWDAIVCRNVLLHCTDDSSSRIADQLASSIASHGVVLFGPGDARPSAPIVIPQRAAPRARSTPPPREPSADELWAEARERIARGAYAAAAGALERLVARAPDRVEAWLALGNVRLATHDLAGAEDAYRAAERIDPLSAELCFLWGALHRKRGAWDDATRALRRALFLDADLWPARYLLAGAWDRAGEHERARAALDATWRSLARRPEIRWRSCVDDIEALACPAEMVRAICAQRVDSKEEVG
ncbi:CheR family methyltransferase [Sandaracinus amylolyticus]|uniref:Chemotaxis protein methyltransferase CheR n=1 Tax=Sandaracinus amylolyticus TaxID=927083 RepID=A0A0F6YIZ7_9BACT|nr:CheR family methyltransferase [Sandaracinus amylolyticus]AKF07303.1 Chemotaxis protein methyltransferase CheR [Sandaracinus amylolyticus]